MKQPSTNNIDQEFYLEPYRFGMNGAINLRLILNAATIVAIWPEVGFFHRATEKIMENKIYWQNLVYMDQIDGTAPMCNEHAYVLAIEKLLNIKPPIRAQYIRVMLDELTRILSHLLWLSNYTVNLGINTITVDCGQLREEILVCFEAITGNRINANYYRPGGVQRDLPTTITSIQSYKLWCSNNNNISNCNRMPSLLDILSEFTNKLPDKLDFFANILSSHQEWQQRTVNVGIVSAEVAISLGFSGPSLRASGVPWDLRKTQPYAVYPELNFNIAVANNGDNYSRYLVRMAEIKESNKIVRQTIAWLKNNLGPIMLDDCKIIPPKRVDLSNNLGSLIQHVKLFGEGFCLPKGECYAAVENPKGEFGVYLVSDGANKPYRIKIRTPSFAHLASLEQLLIGSNLNDLTAILASHNIVTAEVDR